MAMNSIEPLQLDVRPLLKKGEEPFSQIMSAIQTLAPGQALHLKAPFEPKPLYALMAEKGYEVEAECQPDQSWDILFRPVGEVRDVDLTLDLRELEPPEPMQRALESCSRLGRHETLTVLTRFRPVHLMEHLETQGFTCDAEECGPAHWETQIWRA